jgi:hypothetical protein
MPYTPEPFQPFNPYDRQISTELMKANENFKILAQAFVNDDIENEPIKRSVYVGNLPPEDPEDGSLWFDTTPTEMKLSIYIDGNWYCLIKLKPENCLDSSGG